MGRDGPFGAWWGVIPGSQLRVGAVAFHCMLSGWPRGPYGGKQDCGYIGIVMGTRGGSGKEWKRGQENRTRGAKTTGSTNHCNKDTVGGSIGAEDSMFLLDSVSWFP